MRSEYEGLIELALHEGVPVPEVEETIDELGLPLDEARTLKLYAWAWSDADDVKPQRGLRLVPPPG